MPPACQSFAPEDGRSVGKRDAKRAETERALSLDSKGPRMSTLLYQQANIEIYWDDRSWLYVDWIGMQSVQNFRDGCAKCFNSFR
jgi:hypothetical protein